MNTNHPLTQYVFSLSKGANIWHHGSIVRLRIEKSLYENEWHMLQDFLELSKQRGHNVDDTVLDLVKGIRAGIEDPNRLMWDGFFVRVMDVTHSDVKEVFNYVVNENETMFLEKIREGYYMGYLSPHWAFVYDFIKLVSLVSPMPAVAFANASAKAFKAAVGEIDNPPHIGIKITRDEIQIGDVVVKRINEADDEADDEADGDAEDASADAADADAEDAEMRIKRIKSIYQLSLHWENGKVVAYPDYANRMDEQDKQEWRLGFEIGAVWTEVTDMDDNVHNIPVYPSDELKEYLEVES